MAGRVGFSKMLPRGDGGVIWVADNDKAREKFADATVVDGVPRWNTNNTVPPADIVAQWVDIGLPIDEAKATAARDADSAKFFAEYRKRQANRTPEEIAEHEAEMRAAFGPGETVVNVFTGRVTKL